MSRTCAAEVASAEAPRITASPASRSLTECFTTSACPRRILIQRYSRRCECCAASHQARGGPKRSPCSARARSSTPVTLDHTEYSMDTTAVIRCKPGQIRDHCGIGRAHQHELRAAAVLHAGPAAESSFLLVFASCVAQMLVGGLWMLVGGLWMLVGGLWMLANRAAWLALCCSRRSATASRLTTWRSTWRSTSRVCSSTSSCTRRTRSSRASSPSCSRRRVTLGQWVAVVAVVL